jgi:hypothetical protein
VTSSQNEPNLIETRLRKAFIAKVREIEANNLANVKNIENNRHEVESEIQKVQNLHEGRKQNLKDKANELINLKTLFKSLLNQTDNSVLKKADMLEEGLDELDRILKQK